MGGQMPKQFLNLGDVPIIIRTIQPFLDFFSSGQIIVVVPKQYTDHMNQLAEEYHINGKIQVVKGGHTRFDSVRNGLQHLEDTDHLVAVHDAVRPMVDADLIKRLFSTAAEKGNSIPVIKVKDSVRAVSQDSSQPVDRSTLRIIQTPQVFNAKLLMQAYEQAYEKKFTDCASVVENMGVEIFFSEGSEKNIKITTQGDLRLAELMLIS